MNLIDIYKSLLSTAGMTSDEDGFISMQLAATDKKPVVIKGKRLVLPIDVQLRNPDFSNRVVFHPLSESILRGESEVVTAFREAISKRLNFIIGYLSIILLDLAVSTAEHPKLSPDQTEFLTKVKDTDEATVQRLQKITEAMLVGDNSRAFVHIRVQKNGEVAGKKHRRVGLIYFPFYEEVKKVPSPKEPNEIYGIKLRKADRETFKSLMEYLIPGIDKPENWMFPSDSEIAPTMDALMKTVIAVGDPINSVVDLFKSYINGAEDLYFNGEWEESFSDLNSLHSQIRLIPMQPGNEGRIPPTSPNAITVETPINQPSSSSTSKPATRPTLGQSPEETAKASIRPPQGGLSNMAVGESVSQPVQPQPHPLAPQMMQPMQQQQPGWMQPSIQGYPTPGYPVSGGYPAGMVPAMGYVQPMMQPAQPVQQPTAGLMPGTIVTIQTPQGPAQAMVGQNGQLVPVQQQVGFQPNPPQVRHTARGLDFNSVLAANPQMAANMQQPMMGFGGPQVAQATPSWARPGYIGV